jgi:hypothetical protein
MPYEAEISSAHPTYVVLLIDQSGSMDAPFTDSGRPKSAAVADALNQLVWELVKRARASGSNRIKNYYDVSVIGYNTSVQSLFQGELTGMDIVTINQLRDNPYRIEQRMETFQDAAGRPVRRPVPRPVWVETTAFGRTYMAAALEKAHSLVSEWVEEHPRSFPPIVINLTDGLASDEGPEEAARRLRALSTEDGQVLLFNLHVSSAPLEPVLYPVSPAGLTPEGVRLFEMSSELPDALRETAQSVGVQAQYGARGLVFNGNIVDVMRLFEIGTMGMRGGQGTPGWRA